MCRSGECFSFCSESNKRRDAFHSNMREVCMQRQKISWARSSCAAANRPVNPAANPIRLLIMCIRVEDDIPCGFKNEKALILSIQIIDSARVFHYEGRLHAISRDGITATAAILTLIVFSLVVRSKIS